MDKPLFSLPAGLLDAVTSAVEPPPWLVTELQARLVLFLNHVLAQEPQAMERLQRQRGKVVQLRWGHRAFQVEATPAGLLTAAGEAATADLQLQVAEGSVALLVQALLDGRKPALDVQGDVELAATVAWLVDNVRWDVEEDLSRWIGDAASHGIAQAAWTAVEGIRAFLHRSPGRSTGGAA